MVRTYSRQWVSNFKFDIPEFNGCMQPHEFLDWVVAVEETLEFKEVPLGKQVPLVATKFRGLAAAWWQYLKQTRVRQGVHVAIEEIRRTTLPKENASEASPLPINVVNVMDIPALGIKFNQEQVEEEYANYFTPVEESNIQQEPRSAFANGSCVFSDSYIPPIIRCDKPNVIKGLSFQDGKVTEDDNWVFCDGAWDDSSLVVAFYRNVDKGLRCRQSERENRSKIWKHRVLVLEFHFNFEKTCFIPRLGLGLEAIAENMKREEQGFLLLPERKTLV
ncbi:hypothetical protein RHSIM_RhsimUnG0129600 [Rhododendron simsii]|uniref:Retrotransposon gag domain-containing protein n=1 Tax=Rhododendron simsii TaxID=118357 RepID=A0A834FVC6_RHOSS|nr:hypothetical protein RHSIM_RhsimUnG0129600 [Rhododendron simsii]